MRLLPLALFFMVAQAMAAEGFALPDLEGKIHRLSDYRGKWILVNYWATWCPPCREELPELESFYTAESEKAVVLGVNMEDIDHDRLRAFVEEQFLSYPILLAGAEPSRDQLLGPITGLPTSYLIDPKGKVVARQVGPLTAEAIRDFIARYEEQKNRQQVAK
ncbi:MAG: TlpA family protein disulfide reductase [Gammaproteobacteria bacterium]|nr:MAG: TlpA family protein disulfide reductase [Gammaproteobacteria bacterium]